MEWIINDDNFNDKDYLTKIVSEELKKDHQIVDFRINQVQKNLFNNILIDEFKRLTGYNYKIIFFIIEGTRYTIHKSIDWDWYTSDPCPNLINNLYHR